MTPELQTTTLSRYTACYYCQLLHVKQHGRRDCPICRWMYLRCWREVNREATRKHNRDWYYANLETRTESISKWQKENKSKLRQYGSAWTKRNPDKVKIKQHARRARMKSSGGTYTEEDVRKLLALQKFRCANPRCRKLIKKCYEIDHVQPIAKGGTNWPDNLQLLCRHCNQKKQARDPYDWAQDNGRLFI